MANCSSLSPLWFCHHLAGEDRNNCVPLAVPLSVFVSFPCGTIDWSMFCDCAIIWSYSLDFVFVCLFFSLINN